MTTPLTRSRVFTLLTQRKAVLGQMHEAMLIDENFYFWASGSDFMKAWVKNYIKGFPKEFTPLLPPLGFIGVQRALNNTITGETPDVEVIPPEGFLDADGKDTTANLAHKASLEKIRRWCKATLYSIDTFSTETPIRDFYAKMYTYGLGVMSYPLNTDRWVDPPFGWIDNQDGTRRPRGGRDKDERAELKKWERRRRMTFPWDVHSLHPVTVFFDPYHDPPRNFIIEEQVTSNVDDYEDYVSVKPSGTDVLIRTTYVSEDEYGIWVGTTNVLTEEDDANIEGIAPNTMETPWIRMAWSGLGDKGHEGDFIHKGKGIIRDARDLISRRLKSMNMKDIILQYEAYGSRIWKGAGATKLRNDWAAHGGPGYDMADETGQIVVQSVAQMQVHEAALQMDDETDTMLEQVLGPDLLGGKRAAGETAKGQQSRASYAQAPQRAPKQNGQQLLAAMLLDMLYAIKYSLKYQVTVQDITLKPSDIPDGLLLKVNISPLTEEDKAFQRASLMDEINIGLTTLEDAIRQLNPLANPEQIIKQVRVQRIVDAVLNSPAILQMVLSGGQQAIAPPVMPQQTTGAPQATAPAQADQQIQQPDATNGSAQDGANMAMQAVNAPALAGAISGGPQ